MMQRKDWFARLLDRLSGTYPNDERTSHINEQGFALVGFFYIFAMAARSVYGLVQNWRGVKSYMPMPDQLIDRIMLGIMVLIILVITVQQRRSETSPQKKTHVRLHLTELPRAAAVLLSGKSPEDERVMHIYERAFAVCGLLGIAYFGFSVLFIIWSRYCTSSLIYLCLAPVLLGYVKLRENILTPPRALHIRLNPKNLLLRLPVYLLIVLPFFWLANYLPGLYDSIGGPQHNTIYSESLFIMFLQVIRDSLVDWVHEPWLITGEGWQTVGLIFLGILIFHEFIVWVYRKQMQKMDAEENDLT